MGREELIELLEPTVNALGYELVDLTWGGGRGKLLRLYIGKAHEPVTIGDCERASRAVSEVLDARDPIPGHYTLEVSSPGDRAPRSAGREVEQIMRVDPDGVTGNAPGNAPGKQVN
jgi:ribosome maturation factor RimP